MFSASPSPPVATRPQSHATCARFPNVSVPRCRAHAPPGRVRPDPRWPCTCGSAPPPSVAVVDQDRRRRTDWRGVYRAVRTVEGQGFRGCRAIGFRGSLGHLHGDGLARARTSRRADWRARADPPRRGRAPLQLDHPPRESRLRTERSSGRVGVLSPSSTPRYPRYSRSSCAPVARSAESNSLASFSGVATRVSARTFAYDSLAVRSDSSMAGSFPSARATRTFSRAVAGSHPRRHASQCAHEIAPCSCQPHASSKRLMHSSRRCAAASRCADSTAIS